MAFTDYTAPADADRRRIRINKKIMRLNTTSAITIGEGYARNPKTAMLIQIEKETRRIRIRMCDRQVRGSWAVQDSRFVRLRPDVIEDMQVDMEQFEVFMELSEDGWWYGDLKTAHLFRRSNKKN